LAIPSQQEKKIPNPEDDFAKPEESYLKALGASQAVQRLRRRWGKVRTRMHVFGGSKCDAEWLQGTGRMSKGGLDALIEENRLTQQSPEINARTQHYEWADTYLQCLPHCFKPVLLRAAPEY
jgi:hypothetical protein